MSRPERLARKLPSPAEQALATLSPEERTRYETIKLAADKTRHTAHWMLDEQLDTIMPELLTHIDGGGTFGVFVVDPQQMPVIPEDAKLVTLNGHPIRG